MTDSVYCGLVMLGSTLVCVVAAAVVQIMVASQTQRNPIDYEEETDD